MTNYKDVPLPPDQSWIADTGVTRRQALAGTVVAASYALAAQPLSATAIATSADGLDAGMVTFATGGIQMGAYRAKPKGRKNLPVIIVVQEILGYMNGSAISSDALPRQAITPSRPTSTSGRATRPRSPISSSSLPRSSPRCLTRR